MTYPPQQPGNWSDPSWPQQPSEQQPYEQQPYEQQPSYDLLRIQVNPIPIKAALNELGHQVGGYRLPMVEPTDEERAAVRACLDRLSILQTSTS